MGYSQDGPSVHGDVQGPSSQHPGSLSHIDDIRGESTREETSVKPLALHSDRSVRYSERFLKTYRRHVRELVSQRLSIQSLLCLSHVRGVN